MTRLAKAVWAWRLSGRSLISRAWEARLEEREDLARRWAEGALANAHPLFREGVARDVTTAPAMDRPGLRVRARRPCPFCEGTGVSPVPLGRSPLKPKTLPPDDDWGDCPTCRGEGVVRLSLDEDTEEVLRAMTPEGTADISWDWPPELYSGDLAQEFGLLDEGYDGREAR